MMKNTHKRDGAYFIKPAPLIIALFVVAINAATADQRFFGLGQPNSINELPVGEFRSALEALPPTARGKALSELRRLTTPAQDFPHMRVDKRGHIHYVDPVVEVTGEEAETPLLPEDISEADVFKLHSKPDASSTLYIDFDGHQLINTAWNSYSGASTLDMNPFDLDGDPSAFSSSEVARIAESWRRVAEDFAAFDVDVTTEQPPVTIGTGGRIEFGTKVGHNLVTQEQDANGVWVYTQGGCGCGGVAYLNVFGVNASYGTGLTFNKTLSSNALTISHETGHNLGLSHDGTSSKSYYSGHGSGATSWGPIMGAPFGVSLSQWSKNEYPGANNPEDDFEKIKAYINFRADDHEDVYLDSATLLQVTDDTNVISNARVSDPSWTHLANKGIIEDHNDIDLYSMSIGVGTISLNIDPAEYETYEGSSGANLDIEVKLLDEFGDTLQVSNPDLETGASINYFIETAGTYYLEITGVARSGTGGSDYGHSDYGVVGQYYINGFIPEDVWSTDPPIAPNDLKADKVNDVNIELSWTDDPDVPPGQNETGYRVFRSKDGADFGLLATIARDSDFYADNNLSNGSYSYYVEVFNSVEPDVQSNTTDPLLVENPTVAIATSEFTGSGSIQSGSYINTQVDLGSETLVEQQSGGKPQNRTSSLDHSWLITNVVPGATINLFLNANVPENTDGDNFVFTYSVNDGEWMEIGTVNNGTDENFSISLDPTINGTVEINVTDSDQTKGSRNTDTVIIKEIKITSVGNPDDQFPVIKITSPSTGTTIAGETELVLEATANDYEDGNISSSIEWRSDIYGSIGIGANLNVILSGGSQTVTHNITASATDTAGQESTATITVIVDDTPPATSMSPSIVGSNESTGRGGKWQANASITVVNNYGNPVNDAIVNGSWSNGTSGSSSCETNDQGQCTVSKGGLKGNTSSVTFTITSISKSPLTYTANSDHVVILKP
jgi:hypothetical protein